MTRAKRGWLAWGLVLAACAGPGGAGRPRATLLGGGRPLLAGWGAAPAIEDEEPRGPELGEATARQRESECRLLAAHQWRILAPIDAMGTEVEFTYWASQGALTMLSWRRVAEGEGQGEAADERAFAEKLWPPLLAYVGEAPRKLRLVQRREKGQWVLKSLEASGDDLTRPPPEAKTLPVDVPDIAAGSFATLENAARARWLPMLKAPADGGARLELRVEFEDERLVDSSPARYETSGRGVNIGPPPAFDVQVAGGLAPFTQGLGRRAVRLVLVAKRTGGEAPPRWRVEGAATERPKAVETTEPFTTHTDYRLLHEEILRRWREDVHSTAVYAASFTVEQAALWIVGGWVARGAGRLFELAAVRHWPSSARSFPDHGASKMPDPVPVPLPGLDHLLSVLKSHDEAINLRPPPAAPPRAGDIVLGEPFDPMLAELYSRFDGGRLGDLYISSFNAHRDSLVPLNQRSRERAEARVQKLLCYAEIGGLAEDFATVSSLAGTDGTQPVVYFQDYMDKVIMPFASNVDRAFELYARHCETWIRSYGSLDAEPPPDRQFPLFPRSYVSDIARDWPLVRLLADGRFDDLILPDEASREWVRGVLAAARELH